MTTSRKAARANDESSEDDGVDEESFDDSCVVESLVGSVGEKGGDDDIVDNSLPGSNNHLPRESIICCDYEIPILTYDGCDWKDIKGESIVCCYYDCPILTNGGLLL